MRGSGAGCGALHEDLRQGQAYRSMIRANRLWESVHD